MVTPFAYRDGYMYGQVVGAAEPMQRASDRAPDGLDVRIDEPTERRGPSTPGGSLSERQREAVEVRSDWGYYEQPRAVTNADVAEELDCAPATASDPSRRRRRSSSAPCWANTARPSESLAPVGSAPPVDRRPRTAGWTQH